jgi:internalin A
LTSLASVEPLRHLRFLSFSQSGDLDSLSPLSNLTELRELYAWGTTRVLDGDLSPLFELPALYDVRMRDRRNYRPRMSTLKELLVMSVEPPHARPERVRRTRSSAPS